MSPVNLEWVLQKTFDDGTPEGKERAREFNERAAAVLKPLDGLPYDEAQALLERASELLQSTAVVSLPRASEET